MNFGAGPAGANNMNQAAGGGAFGNFNAAGGSQQPAQMDFFNQL